MSRIDKNRRDYEAPCMKRVPEFGLVVLWQRMTSPHRLLEYSDIEVCNLYSELKLQVQKQGDAELYCDAAASKAYWPLRKKSIYLCGSNLPPQK